MSFCQYFCEPQNESWKHFGMSTLLAVYAHSLPFDVFVKISYAKAPATESKSESWALMIWWKQRCDSAYDFAAYEPVKTRLSESEAKQRRKNQTNHKAWERASWLVYSSSACRKLDASMVQPLYPVIIGLPVSFAVLAFSFNLVLVSLLNKYLPLT